MAEETKTATPETLMEWQFPEFVQHARGRGWYLGFMITVIALSGIAIWSANYTFVLIIILGALIVVIRLRMHPPLVTFTIHEEGVEVSGRIYRWEELKEFWIIYKPPEVKKLFLEFKGTLRPALDVSLETQNPLKVRQLLNEYLLENTTREEEPVTDQWSRMLKL